MNVVIATIGFGLAIAAAVLGFLSFIWPRLQHWWVWVLSIGLVLSLISICMSLWRIYHAVP